MVKKSTILSGIDIYPPVVWQSKQGDVHASRQLLREAIRALEEKGPLCDSVRDWLVQALREVEQGATQGNAFKLIPPKRRPDKLSEETQIFITEQIIDSDSGRHKAINKDESSMGIYAKLAATYKVTPTTIENIYKKHRDGVLDSRRLNEELRRENETEFYDGD